jgi:channel protein (hemolysin III family)
LCCTSQVKPALRGVLHQHAAFAAIAAGALLIAAASSPEAKLACGVYVASLVALFSASAVYHVPMWSPAVRALLRRVDHASIYVLIAGDLIVICCCCCLPRLLLPFFRLLAHVSSLSMRRTQDVSSIHNDMMGIIDH